MKCNSCRNEIPDDAKFCPVCGAPTEGSQEQNADTPKVQEPDTPAAENPYQYGVPQQNTAQDSYQYGAPQQDQTQDPYQYGAPQQNTAQDPYQYGAPQQDQAQDPYQFGAAGESAQSQYEQQQNTQPQYDSPQYNQQQYGQPQQMNGTVYIIFAVLVTLLCCLPLGIAAIVYASKINSLQRSGDIEGAKNAAKKARLFSIIGAVGGLIVTIILIATTIIGGSDSNTPEPSNPVGQIVQEKKEEPKTTPADNKKEDAKPAAQSGSLGSAWTSYTVQINDKVLTIPCTMEDVKATGLVLDTDYTPENYMVNANEYVLAYFEDDKENEVMVYAFNGTSSAIELKDCQIGGVSVDQYGLEKGGLTVMFPGGVQIGASKDSVLNTYGDANDSYEGDSIHMYTWYDGDAYDKQCEIDFDAKTGLVYEMSIRNMGN